MLAARQDVGEEVAAAFKLDLSRRKMNSAPERLADNNETNARAA
jgi:hypothetical protein